MNGATRKELARIADDLSTGRAMASFLVALRAAEEAFTKAKEDLVDAREGVAGVLEDARTEIETIKDDEQEKFDNMPDGLQQGEKGQAIEEAVGTLDDAIATLNEIAERLRDESSLDDEAGLSEIDSVTEQLRGL